MNARLHRLCTLIAWAVFLCPLAWGQASTGLSSGTSDSVARPRVTRMEDTLRPIPWQTAVWQGKRFRVVSKDDEALSVPLPSGQASVSALGSPDWVFGKGLQYASSVDAARLGYWSNSANVLPEQWVLRKGPLPMVDWVGQSAQGRGQEFGVVASASPKYYQHFWMDYRRLQMSGGLLPEDHFADRLKTAFWGRDSAHTWRYRLLAGIHRTVDGESGGVPNLDLLTLASSWQPNRNLVPTRWTTAQRSGRTLSAQATLVHARSNLGLEVDWSQSTHGFGGAPTTADSLRYAVVDVRFGRFSRAFWSEPAMRGISSILLLPRIRAEWSIGLRGVQVQSWNSGVWSERNVGPQWSPVLRWAYPGRRNVLNAEWDVLRAAAEASYARLIENEPMAQVKVVQRWTMPWEGQVVDQVRRATLWVQPWRSLTLHATFSSSDPVLRVERWDAPEAQWSARPAWAVAGLDWHSTVRLSRSWSFDLSAQGRWASISELGLAPANGTLKLVYARSVAGLYPGMRIKLELQGQGWSGGWQRPVWVAERGLFAFSDESDAMPMGGLVHAAVMLYLGEAQLGVVVQNANQGWVPNTVFMAQHYPVTPASVRWFLRWRMFE
ncbi:MAG: hypothetical protein ACKOX0_03575 [Bacteroidota bacterium]